MMAAQPQLNVFLAIIIFVLVIGYLYLICFKHMVFNKKYKKCKKITEKTTNRKEKKSSAKQKGSAYGPKEFSVLGKKKTAAPKKVKK